MYDYNARYYSAVLGRFVSPDSIVPEPGNPQAFNRYSYVYGNPLKYNDPSGHCPPCDPWGPLRNLWDYAGEQINEQIDEPFKETRRTLFKAGYDQDLPKKLIDHHIDKSTPLGLTVDEMIQTGVNADIGASKAFQEELNLLTDAGGGTESIQVSGPSIARTYGTLGNFTINYNGDLAVNEDGSWVFEGTMNFHDGWDFDSKPFNETHRTLYGEVLTHIGDYFLPGEGFKVTSPNVPVTQNSPNKYADWVGANYPDQPSRLAREIVSTKQLLQQ